MTKKIKVLVIDDEIDFCYFVKNNLMHDGLFDVTIATNGKDGIELAESEPPDIILLDLLMPDMPGEDVAAVLKDNSSTANIPILFITALATSDDVVDGKENKIGNNYILPKPVRTKKLIETILKILGKQTVRNIAEPVRVDQVLPKGQAVSLVSRWKRIGQNYWDRVNPPVKIIIVLIALASGVWQLYPKFSQHPADVTSNEKVTISMPEKLSAAMPYCPSGYKLEVDGTKCVKNLTPDCPSRYTLASGACQATETAPLNCPAGTTSSAVMGQTKCVRYSEPIISCPSGYTYNRVPKSVRLQCVSLAEPPISCPSGYAYYADAAKCRQLQTPNCPSGFHWNALNKNCVRAMEKYPASCPLGMSYDAMLGKCVSLAELTVSCPIGYTYNAATKKCVSLTEPPISCPSDYTYYADAVKCRQLQTPNCPSGFHWNTPNKYCVTVKMATPSCPPGSNYDAGKAVCEESATPYCAAGYTLKLGQCTKSTGTVK